MKLLISHLVIILLFTISCSKQTTNKDVVNTQSNQIQTNSSSNKYSRSQTNQARDSYRHPQETLKFFNLKPEHSVVELWTGAGWYTEILAPKLKDKGELIVVNDAQGEDVKPQYKQRRLDFYDRLQKNPDYFGSIKSLEFNFNEADILEKIPAAIADRVFTFRNIHNWMKAGYEETIFLAAYKMLKPGGVFGVVEHRANPETSREEMIQSGYVTEDAVIQLAQKVGFKLDAQSEINANPKDTKDHPQGVWSLPPVLRGGDAYKEKFESIGESDRMTLRFVKPAE